MTTRLSVLVFFFAFFILACSDDEDCCSTVESGDVFIVSEGQFTQGNATLDIYNTTSDLVQVGAFAIKNSRPLGDILNSITFFDDRAFLIVNNSQRIEVIREDDYSSIATITENLNSPRFGVIVQEKLYVSELFSPQVHVFDANSYSALGSITTPQPVEEMVVHDNLIFATATAFLAPLHHVYIMDVNAMTVIDSIEVGGNPNAIVKDAQDNIWVMCNGFVMDTTIVENQGLYRINPVSRTVEGSMEFENMFPTYPGRLVLDPSDGRTLYMDRPGGIARMDIQDTEVPSSNFISTSSVYGLGIHPQSGFIFVGDANDFVSPGALRIFDKNGNLVSAHTTGVSPARFYFR